MRVGGRTDRRSLIGHIVVYVIEGIELVIVSTESSFDIVHLFESRVETSVYRETANILSLLSIVMLSICHI